MSYCPLKYLYHLHLKLTYVCLIVLPLLSLGSAQAYFSETKIINEKQAKSHGQISIKSRYIDANGTPIYTNKLIHEDSTYLKQHAHNPINWQPWEKAAFDQAKKENKPIFLSIGYATCHWCHVMEEESFDNEKIANYLNANFISIKVDREQHPDLDEIYLTALQIFSGQAGWPITSFTTPNAKPFLVSSYLTSEELMDQLQQVNQRWQSEQSNIEQMADELYGYVKEALQLDYKTINIRPSLIDEVIKKTLLHQDKQWGGIEQKSKFPMAPLLALLMKQSSPSSSENKLNNFITSHLDAMLKGAIYDQVSGGFHRYTSDRAWRNPHYEKMLYDQAQSIDLYSQAWLIYLNPEYKRIALETANFVINNMQGSNNCFYSAIDADSANGSNDFYQWQLTDITSQLNEKEFKLFNDIYSIAGVSDINSQGPLFLQKDLKLISLEQNISYQQLIQIVNTIRGKLSVAQKQRSVPNTDKSQILQWNAITISALAKLGYILKESKFTEAAEACAQSIWSESAENKGKLTRILSQKNSQLPALLVDHSQLLTATLTLFDITKKEVWLNRAKQLYKTMLNNYFDQSSGTFFNTSNSHVGNILRTQYVDDTIMPSGNSSALTAMVMLHQRAGTSQLKQRIKQLISSFSNTLNQRASSMSTMLSAVAEYKKAQAKQIVYAGQGNIRLSSKAVNSRSFDIEIDIKYGWHINSHQPIQKQLIATNINIIDIASSNHSADVTIKYPKGKLQNLGFNQESLSLYSEKIIIPVKYSNPPSLSTNTIEVQLQACNDKLCLLPEKLRLKLDIAK